MVQYALPTANSDLGTDPVQCAGDGDGDYFDELDEGFGAGRGTGSGPDDATTDWYQGNTSGRSSSHIRCALQSVTDPVSSSGHIIRSRVVKVASSASCNTGVSTGQQVDAWLTLLQTTTDKASSSLANIGSSWTTFSYTLSSTEADSITDYTALRLESYYATVGGGTPRRLSVSALEFECPAASGSATIVAAQGSFSETGEPSGFAVSEPSASASFTLAGEPTAFDVKEPSAVGTLVLTGEPVLFDVKVPNGNGTYTLTGNAATLQKNVPLAGASGSYVLTGEPAGFDLRTPVDTSTFTFTGNVVTFGVGSTSDSGTFTATGTAASFAVVLPADDGLFTLSGQPAALTKGRTVLADTGSFTLTGEPLTFTISLPEAAGPFTLTGQTANLNKGATVIAAFGAFTEAGESAGFALGTPHDVGTFIETGESASFAVGLPASAGLFAETGESSGFEIAIPANSASFTLIAASVNFGVTLAGTAGTFVLTGENAVLTVGGGSPVLLAGGAVYALVGEPATFDTRLNAGLGSLLLNGGATGAGFGLTMDEARVRSAYRKHGGGQIRNFRTIRSTRVVQH